MKYLTRLAFVSALFLALFHIQFFTLRAQGTAFTYQGRLNNNGSPASGSYDLAFTLFVTNTSGVPIAGPVTNAAVTVSNGLFTTTVDFGNVFTNASNWLQIAMSTNAANAFVTLTPRQQLTPVPYAIFANTASNLTGTLLATHLSGMIASGNLPTGLLTNNSKGVVLNGAFSGNGAGLTNFTATNLPAGILTNNALGVVLNGTFSGDGSALTNLNANVAQLNANQTFTGVDTFASGIVLYGLNLAPRTNGAVTISDGCPANYIYYSATGGTISGGGSTNYSGAPEINEVQGDFGTVGGGLGNTAGLASVVGGGYLNSALNGYAVVGGGYGNRANNELSTICGGIDNSILTFGGFIGGGGTNNASMWAVVGGGVYNSAGDYGAVGGGIGNGTALCGTVGGGTNNYADELAAVGGGGGNDASDLYSTVCGGNGNSAGGQYSVVVGGHANVADGAFAFAGGNHAQANYQGDFVWADDNGGTFSATGINQFCVRAGGGFYFYSGPGSTGVYLASGSGSWSSLSDRNAKENFQPVDAQKVLTAVAAMPMTTWNYKTQAQSIRHVGPMAQDFHAAFNVGENETSISTVDEGGVALAAIQGLNQKLEATEQTVQEKDAKISELEKRLNDLEQMVQTLAAKK